ncbi:MAG: hypothetical protein GY856_09855 [bacterium]|nr:hypothetical protein [bacterium]
MLILIKGPPKTGKSRLADRLVSALDLEPVAWTIPADVMQQAQGTMGDWVELSTQFFGRCRHLDLQRLATQLQIENRGGFPPPPQWRPGSELGEMLKWREQIERKIHSGHMLPELFRLSCRYLDATEHAVVEGTILGSTLNDSLLTKMLRRRYLERPLLQILLRRGDAGDAGGDGAPLALVNGKELTHDEVVEAVRRRPDGGITVDPGVGWTWGGKESP